MPNKVKYNPDGTENALFRGNWAIDTSPTNSGGGPSNVTGLYNGAEVPEGGYVLYEDGKVRTLSSDTELINYANSKGAGAANINDAIGWTRTQGMVALDRDYENVVVDGKFGLFNNGDFRSGDNTNFTWGTFNNTDQFSGSGCIEYTGGGGGTALSNDFIEVDTSKTYQMVCYARTLQRGSQNNSLAGGHIGFSCYDEDLNTIYLWQLGGIGNTTLSREASPGDSEIYITSDTNWYNLVNNLWYFRYVLFYPATHPKYSTPYEYTRVGTSPYVLYDPNIQLTAEGDYKLELVTTGGSPTTLPNLGYSLPAGTPVSNGRAGGTFNYALGAPNYPETWTRYATPPFTGESRNSEYPFRYGTKYIKFLILLNYNKRSESPQDHKWALDDIFFGEVGPGVDYRYTLLP